MLRLDAEADRITMPVVVTLLCQAKDVGIRDTSLVLILSAVA